MSDTVAIGVDAGGTRTRAALVAADGTVGGRAERPTRPGEPSALVDVVVEVVHALAGRSGGDPVAVGVGIAGLVDAGGTLRYGPNLAVRDVALVPALHARLGLPVTVLNDATAAALGEQRAGAARGRRDVVLLTIGTGVGGGVVVDGQVVTGANGFAGELGHVVVQEGGRACPCGNRGCVEAYASGRAIAAIVAERLASSAGASVLRERPEPSGADVAAAAAAGDELAAGVLAEAGRWLGVALASIVNALDPELVLLGGGAAPGAAPWLLPAARAAMAERLVGAGWRTPPPVDLASLGDDAGAIGAALHALARVPAT